MSDKTWKAIERRVAAFFGGSRVPVTGRQQRGDAPDVRHPVLSFEVKHRQSLPGWLLEAMEQAEASRRDDQKAIVVLHEKGSTVGESLAIMRCSDILKLLSRIEELEDDVSDLVNELQLGG